MKQIFQDNVVILTGASSGIGYELAKQLAGYGAKLVLASRDHDKLNRVANECHQLGGDAIVVPTDVAKEDECQRLVKKTVQAFGRVDTLINNAGISMWAKFEEMESLEPFQKIMQVNYMGAVYCTYYALPYLKQTQGRLVGIGSLAGKTGVPTRTGYSASKHALMGFFDSLRIELLESGVTVTMVSPGFVTSEIRTRAFGGDGQPLGESPVQEEKVMTPAECAHIILKATAKRKREEVMTLLGKVGQWMKLLAPTAVDRIALNKIQKGK